MLQNSRSGETIVAVATSAGPPAALAIVRISGADTRRILERVLWFPAGTSASLAARRPTLGWLVDPADGARLDQVLVTLFLAPRSFTGEDLAELSLHGSAWLVAEALRILVGAGARAARAGEFTRRALANGKLDLARAEAVAELTFAQSSQAAKLAARHLSGELSDRYRSFRDRLVDAAGLLEGPIEFPDDAAEDEAWARAEGLRVLRSLADELSMLASTQALGGRIAGGIEVPIVGRPNAGKSSLFNALLGMDRAITSPLPGTTRDTIEAGLHLDGQLVRLVDTAGLEPSEDALVIEGIRRAKARIAAADLVVLVLDASAPLAGWDAAVAARVGAKAVIAVASKCDLGRQWNDGAVEFLGLAEPPLAVSVVDGTGLDDLRRRLAVEVARSLRTAETLDTPVTSARQSALLERGAAELRRGCENLARGAFELAVEDVRAAQLALEEILGSVSNEDVLDRVFQRFCIGK